MKNKLLPIIIITGVILTLTSCYTDDEPVGYDTPDPEYKPENK